MEPCPFSYYRKVEEEVPAQEGTGKSFEGLGAEASSEKHPRDT